MAKTFSTAQVGHGKTGCCMAALWLQVYLTPLKRKHPHASASEVLRLTSAPGDDAWPTNVPTYTCARKPARTWTEIPSITNENVYQAIESSCCYPRYPCSLSKWSARAVDCATVCTQQHTSHLIITSAHVTSQPRIWLSCMPSSCLCLVGYLEAEQ